MNIIYAHFAPTPPYITQHREKPNLIPQYEVQLLQAYDDFSQEILTKANKDDALLKKKVRAFNTKICFCGGSLRFVKPYGFWGCDNYKNKLVEHITFQNFDPVITADYIRIKSTWLSDIILKCGLKGKVFVKQLYEYYMEAGLDDLRLKYGRDTSEKTFNGFIKAKARSKDQEEYCEAYLKEQYKKVAVQQCIHYQIDEKKSFCIPDFIVSDNESVTIIDAKLTYPEDEKMDRYVALVEFILRQKGDNREVKGAFFMYEEAVHQYTQSRYSIIKLQNDFSSVH